MNPVLGIGGCPVSSSYFFDFTDNKTAWLVGAGGADGRVTPFISGCVETGIQVPCKIAQPHPGWVNYLFISGCVFNSMLLPQRPGSHGKVLEGERCVLGMTHLPQ